MIRGLRSAKVAEYLSTYSILESIGIHETALIEHRDPSVKFGVFVRDACDAGTALFVIPSKRICAPSVLEKIGVPLRLQPPSDMAVLDDGLITFLTGASCAVEWVSWCWRVALERHRTHSHLWGWLQSVPSTDDFTDAMDHASRLCRVHHTGSLPFFTRGQATMAREITDAFDLLRAGNVMPGRQQFAWAAHTLLSRGTRLPRCWPSEKAPLADSDASAADAAFELGVVPYADLVNGPDADGRCVNARLEVATTVEELPDWYKASLVLEAERKGRDGLAALDELVSDGRYCMCLTLTAPLRASAEVIADYPLTPLTTGVLKPEEDVVVTRLLQYNY